MSYAVDTDEWKACVRQGFCGIAGVDHTLAPNMPKELKPFTRI